MRSYGGRIYSRASTIGVDWLHAAGKRGQLDMDGSIAFARYPDVREQDGQIFVLGARYERALGNRSSISLSSSVARQIAHDPGYANVYGSASLLATRQQGRTTVFVSFGLRRLVADQPLLLFGRTRREWLEQSEAGASIRSLAVAGFAPLMRISYERNRSTVSLYAYKRTAISLGAVRAF